MFVVTLFVLLSIIKFVVVAIIVINIVLLVFFLLLLTYSRRYQSVNAETKLTICLGSLESPFANLLFKMDRNLTYSHVSQASMDDRVSCRTSMRSCYCAGGEDVGNHSCPLDMKSSLDSTENSSCQPPCGVCADFGKIAAMDHKDGLSVIKNNENDDLDSLYHWSSTFNCWSENNNYVNEVRPYLLAIDNITDMGLFRCREDVHKNVERSFTIFSEHSKGNQMHPVDVSMQASEVEKASCRVSTGLETGQKDSDRSLGESIMKIPTIKTLTMTSENLSASNSSLAFQNKTSHQECQIYQNAC